MAEQTTTETPAVELRGRLVLASGAIVRVPAESVAQATEHYDPKLKETVPVTGRYTVAPATD
jgi:hypothetical protein